jgi:hypothetical protein
VSVFRRKSGEAATELVLIITDGTVVFCSQYLNGPRAETTVKYHRYNFNALKQGLLNLGRDTNLRIESVLMGREVPKQTNFVA